MCINKRLSSCEYCYKTGFEQFHKIHKKIIKRVPQFLPYLQRMTISTYLVFRLHGDEMFIGQYQAPQEHVGVHQTSIDY